MKTAVLFIAVMMAAAVGVYVYVKGAPDISTFLSFSAPTDQTKTDDLDKKIKDTEAELTRLKAEKAGIIGTSTNTTSQDWKEVLISQAPSRFKDPESVRFIFEMESPSPCIIYAYEKQRAPHKDAKGLCGTVNINAKNSYGGYVGSKSYVYVVAESTLTFLEPRENVDTKLSEKTRYWLTVE